LTEIVLPTRLDIYNDPAFKKGTLILDTESVLPTRVEKVSTLPYTVETVIRFPEKVLPETVDIVNRFAKTVEKVTVEKEVMVFIPSELPVNCANVLFIPLNVLVVSVERMVS